MVYIIISALPSPAPTPFGRLHTRFVCFKHIPFAVAVVIWLLDLNLFLPPVLAHTDERDLLP